MGADAADFNHIGQLSLVVTTFDDDIPALFLHDADNYFTDVSLRTGLGYRRHQVGWGVAFLDLDNDGWQDIFMANGHVYPNIDQLKRGSHFREEKNPSRRTLKAVCRRPKGFSPGRYPFTIWRSDT